MDGLPYQYFSYTPWGEEFKSDIQQNATWNSPYKFNGKEMDEETGLYYYGARYYNPSANVWLSVDAKADKYPQLTPYCFSENNPLLFIDPDGNSTWVTDNGDGTYNVVEGGNVDDGDKNIYVVTKNEDGSYSRTDQSIGESISTYSFANDKGEFIKGAVIDMNDHSGEDFLYNLDKADPDLGTYMRNATGGEKYDFKRKGQESMPSEMTEMQYLYRGVKLGGKIASARDVGNIGAGYVAGRSGLTWSQARAGFDALESFQKMKISKEGEPTVRAQRFGYDMGVMKRGSENPD